ncbi:putative aBC transporter, periplasmic substrate-binding protein [Burkholderia mallei]|nr:putative aBC transporter, periplasmic substrate-binding protein [Burkholderia mallei]KOT10878.1 putative aBC transporter, periplasmic substrate-binding protein [Burkholderia mallei]
MRRRRREHEPAKRTKEAKQANERMPHTPAQAIQAHAGRERHTMRSTVRPARPTNAHRGKPAAATGAAHRIRCRYAAACRGDVARQRAGGHASAALPAHDDRIAWPLRPADRVARGRSTAHGNASAALASRGDETSRNETKALRRHAHAMRFAPRGRRVWQHRPSRRVPTAAATRESGAGDAARHARIRTIA